MVSPYLVAGLFGPVSVQVVDVSVASVPRAVAGLTVARGDSQLPVVGIDAAGGYAYIAANSAGLHILDVTNPAAPVAVRTLDTIGWATGVDVDGDLAVVAEFGMRSGDRSGLRLIDVGAAAQPRDLGFVDTPGGPWDVSVVDGYVHVAAGGAGLLIYRITRN